MKGQIYHVEINVSNWDKSGKFYDGFLTWLGYKRIGSWKIGAGWGIRECNVWVFQSKEGFAKDGYHRQRVGLNHIAFHADSKKTVDKFYKEHLQPKRIPVLYGGPKEYPEYSKGYYSVYFEDPDRIKLELAYVGRYSRGFEKGEKSAAKLTPAENS